jgi:YgiT-type zinc finger domain-containing protein
MLGKQCWSCEGIIEEVIKDYPFTLSDGETILVKDVSIGVCNKCGEEFFDHKASHQIESEISRLRPNYYKK